MSSSTLDLPPLPPGSALRFNTVEKRFPSLLQSLEGEMSRLLEWASTGDAHPRPHPPPQRRSQDGGPSHTAEVRHEEVRDFLQQRNDVHQRRAKRREMAESTAVRLPREINISGGAGRSGKQREVSYLSDGVPAAHPSNVPASVIPDAFRIMIESPFPTREPHFYSLFDEDDNWSYDATTRQFKAVLFPSKVPAGRRDVLLLHAWVNDMVARLKKTQAGKQQAAAYGAGSAGPSFGGTGGGLGSLGGGMGGVGGVGGGPMMDEEEMLHDAQLLFSVAFHEIIRQVSVHCLERGYLMGKIWWSEMELFQRLLQLHRQSRAALELERRQRARERDELHGRIDDLEREIAWLRRSSISGGSSSAR